MGPQSGTSSGLGDIQHVDATGSAGRPPSPDRQVKERSVIPTSPVTELAQHTDCKKGRRNELDILFATQGKSSSSMDYSLRSTKRNSLDARQAKREKVHADGSLVHYSRPSDRVINDAVRTNENYGDEVQGQMVGEHEKYPATGSRRPLTGHGFSASPEQEGSRFNAQRSAKIVPSVESEQRNAQILENQKADFNEDLKDLVDAPTSPFRGPDILQRQSTNLNTRIAETSNSTARDLRGNPKITVRITQRKPFQCPVVQCEKVFAAKPDFNCHKAVSGTPPVSN